MKFKFLVIFVCTQFIIFTHNFYAGSVDIFPVGEKKFCRLAAPKGMSRQAWYRQMLAKQDQLLKDEILSLFGLNRITVLSRLDMVKDQFLRIELQDKSCEIPFAGTWSLKKYNLLADLLFNIKNTTKKYTVELGEVEKIKFKLRTVGFLGDIIMSEPSDSSDNTVALAGYRAIYLKPLLFYHTSDLDKLMFLYHELVHIRNEDSVWTTMFEQLLYDAKNQPGRFTVHTIEKASSLIEKWRLFFERRADLEALFDICHEDCFKKEVQKHGGFEGYPFKFSSVCAYPYEAKVNYIKDFIKGLKNDYKLHLAILKQSKKNTNYKLSH